MLIDGSARAQAATIAAGKLAAAMRARLVLVGVVQRPSWFAGQYVSLKALLHDTETQVERSLRSALAEVPADVPVQLQIRHGTPRKVLLDEAATGGHDLVVIPRPRPNFLARCSRRLQKCQVSVLVVPDPADLPDGRRAQDDGAWPLPMTPLAQWIWSLLLVALVIALEAWLVSLLMPT